MFCNANLHANGTLSVVALQYKELSTVLQYAYTLLLLQLLTEHCGIMHNSYSQLIQRIHSAHVHAQFATRQYCSKLKAFSDCHYTTAVVVATAAVAVCCCRSLRACILALVTQNPSQLRTQFGCQFVVTTRRVTSFGPSLCLYRAS
jgi:hypothetical protein